MSHFVVIILLEGDILSMIIFENSVKAAASKLNRYCGMLALLAFTPQPMAIS